MSMCFMVSRIPGGGGARQVCYRTYAAGYIAAVTPRKPINEDGATMKLVTSVMKVRPPPPTSSETVAAMCCQPEEGGGGDSLFLASRADEMMTAMSERRATGPTCLALSRPRSPPPFPVSATSLHTPCKLATFKQIVRFALPSCGRQP